MNAAVLGGQFQAGDGQPHSFGHPQRGAGVGCSLALYRPVTRVARISAPLLVCACDNDMFTPPRPAALAAERAQPGVLKRYPVGHFDIYSGVWFERAVADQIAFLTEALRLGPRPAVST